VWFIDNPSEIPATSTGLFPLVANCQAQFEKLGRQETPTVSGAQDQSIRSSMRAG
jgi:hypothetical protein